MTNQGLLPEKVVTTKQNRAGWRRRGWDCVFEYQAKDGTKKQGKGKRFVVDGVTIELFPSAVLCAIMHKELRTLYAWELRFGFPRALWRNRDDSRCNRYYSRAQLLFIQALFNHYGRLKGPNRDKLKQFIESVKTRFFTIDIPIEQRERKAENE
jgi:hypothetical protein